MLVFQKWKLHFLEIHKMGNQRYEALLAHGQALHNPDLIFLSVHCRKMECKLPIQTTIYIYIHTHKVQPTYVPVQEI